MSPKAGASLVQTCGHEFKLFFPQELLPPEAVQHLSFPHFLLRPMDGRAQSMNKLAALEYCEGHAQWRLSVQLHKVVDIP